jgi:hypothetical protein
MMTEHKGACCSSPAAICYWFFASFIAWGVLSFIGIYWRPLHTLSAATILLAMAIGCVANWLSHRTLHCGITGPLFLIAAVNIPAVRPKNGSRQQPFSLAICSHRSRYRIPAGMALCEAFLIAFGKDINTLKCFVERLKVCAAEKQVLAGAAGLKLAFPDRARDRDSYKRANPREISEFCARRTDPALEPY